MKKSWLCAAACAVSALLAASSPTRADTTLVIGIAADPTGLDPEAVLNNTSGFVMATIYDGLTRYKPGTTEVGPGLAEKWDISADGLTYTFHLRKGATFQDGTPFNAKAYVQGLDRLLNKQSPDSIYNTGPVESMIDFTYEDVASYRAVDDDTVEFKLKQPSAALLASLAMVWNGVVSPTAVTKYGKEFRNHPVGSGPFVFKEWRQRDQVSLDANPNYWGGKPKVDHLVFKEYPDPQAALLALKRGDIQILGDVSTQLVPAMRSDPNIEIVTQPGLAVSGVGLPCDVPPFNDKRVRQALNHAVDFDAIDKSLFQGLAVPMSSPLPESQWGFDKSIQGYKYDPDLAKKMLADAGVKLPLKVEFLTYNSPPRFRAISARSASRPMSAKWTWARTSPLSAPANTRASSWWAGPGTMATPTISSVSFSTRAASRSPTRLVTKIRKSTSFLTRPRARAIRKSASRSTATSRRRSSTMLLGSSSTRCCRCAPSARR
jgi:peptide/nickel transport system substrate-binding protein